MRFLLIDKANQEEDLYVYNTHNILEKHFSISIASVRSRGGLLVYYKMCFACYQMAGHAHLKTN
jgi:hypothetical protein